MSRNAFLFRYLPTAAATFALAVTGALVLSKIDTEIKARSQDALISQWNETERLALAWGQAVDDLSRSLQDLNELRLRVEVGKTSLRFVEPVGASAVGAPDAIDKLSPGQALVLRTGSVNRFEGRLTDGSFVRSALLGLKSFPTLGEGLTFLRRPADGVFFVVAPRNEEVVIAALPPLLMNGLRPDIESSNDFALVSTSVPWLSSVSPGARGPLGSHQIALTNDELTFTPQKFEQKSGISTLLQGPSRFELAGRPRSISLRLKGMGSAPIRGTNLRLVTHWQESIALSQVLMAVASDLGLVAIAALFAATFAFIERVRFLAASRGLRENVRAMLYRREGSLAPDWALSPLVRDEFRDVLRNVDKLTSAHRALHAWGGRWKAGFEGLEGLAEPTAGSMQETGGSKMGEANQPPRGDEDRAAVFLPATEMGPSLGLHFQVLHDEEWGLHLATSPGVDSACLIVMRRVDFRTDILRAFLTNALAPLLRPSRKVRKKAARDALVTWFQHAGKFSSESDPVFWGAVLFAPQRNLSGAEWQLMGPFGNAGFSLGNESEHIRLQWGEEVIADLTLSAPPLLLPDSVATFEAAREARYSVVNEAQKDDEMKEGAHPEGDEIQASANGYGKVS